MHEIAVIHLFNNMAPPIGLFQERLHIDDACARGYDDLFGRENILVHTLKAYPC